MSRFSSLALLYVLAFLAIVSANTAHTTTTCESEGEGGAAGQPTTYYTTWTTTCSSDDVSTPIATPVTSDVNPAGEVEQVLTTTECSYEPVGECIYIIII